MQTKDKVIEILETIEDPELGIDIWTMGLIYDINIKDNNKIDILLTFTSPMCPAGEQIKEEVEDAMRLLKFEEINIKITFNPPWQPPAELKAALGLN
jgi:metal-sulfur cluster biosynthetic enzyme